MTAPVILWFRRDLRLADQAALAAAVDEGPVVPVYILDDETPRHRRMGGASRWWLHHSLESLDKSLKERGSRLLFRRGRSDRVLADLMQETGASRIHALHHHEPWWLNADQRIGNASLDLVLHHGNYLLPPGSVESGSGQAYRIYTPFSRSVMAQMPPPRPRPVPRTIPAMPHWPTSESLDDWGLLPTKPDWAAVFSDDWTPGEAGAHSRLEQLPDRIGAYATSRNLPSKEGSSRLSPHLHFGEISTAAVWHAVHGSGEDADVFRKELIWRDFAQNVIVAIPDYGKRNGRERFDELPWRDPHSAGADIEAWKTGRTGYPIVDAGMRQLWTTGWMHNRVRMITASFLIKHLLIDWRVGEQWFWDTLVDADYANNSVNWQWVAGTGVDANMFGRIMAPLVQSEKFDAGAYIRQWVPELRGIVGDAIHDPESAGVRPKAYPRRIIGHREARERALSAYAQVKG